MPLRVKDVFDINQKTGEIRRKRGANVKIMFGRIFRSPAQFGKAVLISIAITLLPLIIYKSLWKWRVDDGSFVSTDRFPNEIAFASIVISVSTFLLAALLGYVALSQYNEDHSPAWIEIGFLDPTKVAQTTPGRSNPNDVMITGLTHAERKNGIGSGSSEPYWVFYIHIENGSSKMNTWYQVEFGAPFFERLFPQLQAINSTLPEEVLMWHMADMHINPYQSKFGLTENHWKIEDRNPTLGSHSFWVTFRSRGSFELFPGDPTRLCEIGIPISQVDPKLTEWIIPCSTIAEGGSRYKQSLIVSLQPNPSVSTSTTPISTFSAKTSFLEVEELAGDTGSVVPAPTGTHEVES